AVFNMVPGFPLDGGRVLRAIVWWITGNGERATRIAATTGQGIAFVFIIVGLFRFFNGAGFGGLWLTFIGWFLLDAARSSYAQTEILKHLRGVRVRDVMTHNWPAIESGTNLQSFVDEYLLRSGHRNFAVQENGRVIGLITPHEVKDIERDRWQQMSVREAMRPLDRLHSIKPTTPVAEALEAMGREDVNQLVVLSNSHLDGIVSRGNILRLLQTRADLLTERYLGALSRLQDQIEPCPYEIVEQSVSSELGVRISKIFPEFDREPMAAASLAQVHRAYLRDGRAVVVKIQRPGVRDLIVNDLEALEEVAGFIDAHTEVGKRYEFGNLLTDLRRSLLRELDFQREASNLIRLRESLREYKNIVVPRPIEDLTTSRVLTMDYIPGKNVANLSPLRLLEIDGAKLSD